jgi:hypothetical protein
MTTDGTDVRVRAWLSPLPVGGEVSKWHLLRAQVLDMQGRAMGNKHMTGKTPKTPGMFSPSLPKCAFEFWFENNAKFNKKYDFFNGFFFCFCWFFSANSQSSLLPTQSEAADDSGQDSDSDESSGSDHDDDGKVRPGL